MILEQCSYSENDEKSKRETKNREMERDSSECTQQNLMFSPQVYKHLLSSPLFQSRSHMENRRSDIEMVRNNGGGSSRQYFHGNDGGMMKRKYEEEVSGYLAVLCVCVPCVLCLYAC